MLTTINSLIIIIILLAEARRKLKQRRIKSTQLVNLMDVIEAGKYSKLLADTIVTNSETKIGSYCSIAKNVVIGPSQHPTNFLSTHGFQYEKNSSEFPNKNINLCDVSYINKPCIIGNDVWIGRNVIIKDGIKIGDGSIVGCGAIVTHDVPPYAVVAGVPAKILKYRFDEETIKQLLELKWWDMPENILVNLPFDDVKKCIQELKIYKSLL